MIRLVFVYAIVGISLYFVVSEILKFLGAINGSNRQISRDSLRFKERLKNVKVIQWPWEELNLLSQEVSLNPSSRIFSNINEGNYKTIYDEVVAAAITKKYGERYLILIKTFSDHYELTLASPTKGKLTINQSSTCDFDLAKDRFSVSREPGKVELILNGPVAEVVLDGNSVLKTNPADSTNGNVERVLSVVPEVLNEEDQKIVKFLLLFYLICGEIIT